LSIGEGLKIDGEFLIALGKSFGISVAGGYSKMPQLETRSNSLLTIYEASFVQLTRR
jgi:hypothetical protein